MNPTIPISHLPLIRTESNERKEANKYLWGTLLGIVIIIIIFSLIITFVKN